MLPGGPGLDLEYPRSRPLEEIRTSIAQCISLHDLRFINNVQLSYYLKQQGIIPHHTKRGNLWRFLPLQQMRTDWERRFGGWTWDVTIYGWRNERISMKSMENEQTSTSAPIKDNVDTRLLDVFGTVRPSNI